LLQLFGLVSLPNIPLAFPLPSPLFIGTTKLWLFFLRETIIMYGPRAGMVWYVYMSEEREKGRRSKDISTSFFIIIIFLNYKPSCIKHNQGAIK
jgi:hypothetical protein